MDPNLIANIENLLNQLYDHDQPQQQHLQSQCDNKLKFNETNNLLIQLQRSKEAWIFSWLLMDKNKSINIQYFGASTLYLKLTKYSFELQPNDYKQIWLKLIENLFNYINGQEYNLIRIKLISCIANCIVHNIILDEWQNIFNDLWQIFQPDKLPNIPSTRIIQILLEIFTSIPEELNHPYQDKNRKQLIKCELIKHSESILLFIEKILCEENISDNITTICVKCFQSWSIGLDTLILIENNHAKIMTFILNNAIRNENICHDVVECIIAIYTSPHICKQPKMILKLIEQITIILSPIINQAIQESNHEYLRDLYYLFVSIGESNTRLILDSLTDLQLNQDIIIEFFNIILKCSQTPTYYGYDETLSDLPFNFWINFQDDLMASDENKIQIYANVFKNIFYSLINIFLIKLQYPPDDIYLQEWNKDDRERFRCYRQDIADTYTYCFTILNTTLLDILMDHFNKALQQTMIATNQDHKISIRYLEAVIFAFSSLTENISTNEINYMPKIMSSFQSLTPECLNDAKLLSTINCFLSNSADWLANNINYFPFVLTIIQESLKSSDQLVIISSTMALKVIVSECQLDLKPYGLQIIELCEKYLCYSTLEYKEKARLMHSLGSILSIMPIDLIMQTIDRILIPILSDMEKILNHNQQSEQNRIHINGILLMLSNLFAKLDINLKSTELELDGDELISKDLIQSKLKNEKQYSYHQQPLYRIFEKIIPMFGIIVVNYPYDEEIVQNLCECINKTIITLLDDIKPMLTIIIQLLLELYRKSLSINVLQISRQIFVIFANDEDLLLSLQEYFYQITTITIEKFQSVHSNDMNVQQSQLFHEQTFLVQNFYEELAKILRKSMKMFLYEKLDLLKIFDYSMAGIEFPEKSTIHQCSIFICTFLNQSRQYIELFKIIQERFDLLLMKIFIIIGGKNGSPSFAVDYMTDILLIMNQKYSDNFQRSLQTIIDLENFPTQLITKECKQKFIQSVLLTRNNKRKLREIVKEFSYRCRGLFGVDYK